MGLPNVANFAACSENKISCLSQKLEKTGQIEITVTGQKGNHKLHPGNYDIKDLVELLRNAENLLFPGGKRDRPLISYEVQEGSVKHILKTSFQAVLSFNAVLGQIQSDNYSIDFLEYQTANAFEFFQTEARKNNFDFKIGTSISDGTTLTITKDTKFVRSADVWVDAEFYFYGTIVDAGGKGIANVHLDTKDFGLLKIQASKIILANYENNPLYKHYGVRARGKQNIRNTEIDKNSLELIDIIDYQPSFKEDYIKSLIQKAKKSWSDVADADEWLQNARGYGT